MGCLLQSQFLTMNYFPLFFIQSLHQKQCHGRNNTKTSHSTIFVMSNRGVKGALCSMTLTEAAIDTADAEVASLRAFSPLYPLTHTLQQFACPTQSCQFDVPNTNSLLFIWKRTTSFTMQISVCPFMWDLAISWLPCHSFQQGCFKC